MGDEAEGPHASNCTGKLFSDDFRVGCLNRSYRCDCLPFRPWCSTIPRAPQSRILTESLSMTRDTWLTTHPYLRDVAAFQEQCDFAAARIPMPPVTQPQWDNYSEDFHAGVPLLYSRRYAFDFETAGKIVVSLAMALTSVPLSGKLAVEINALSAELNEDSDGPRRAVAWLLDKEAVAREKLGLQRYLGWMGLKRYLRPLIEAFGNWRNEEHWLRNYCPTCGSLPAMAQLVGVDPGRLRFLSCGGCETRWKYRRTGCPFCKIEDDHRLMSVTLEGEEGLRIDYCPSCKSYLKTYEGTENESLLLADWTSLHLDVIARDRGLVQSAESLYEL